MNTYSGDNYDEVPYPGYAHKQTHPDRLAVIATLMGMRPAPVEHCRVLELGCGDGGNLVPMAMSLRESEFVGFDRAARAVASANEVVTGLGLKNIVIKELDVLNLPSDLGSFDYIIAHGFYSWVPDVVKEKILSVCKLHLNPQGVAFVSYNAYPGGHISDMVRNMLLFHLRDIPGSGQRIKQSIAFLKFLAESQVGSSSYNVFMQDELKQTLKFGPELLYHDRIAEVSTPLYFFQFIEHAATRGLQFLGEADFTELQYHSYPSETIKLLEQMAATNIILKEQYLDFLKCRRFRQTLLCHAGLNVNHVPDARAVSKMFIAARAQPVSTPVDLSPAVVVEFVGPHGGKVATDYPTAKAALAHLAEIYPRPLAFASLFDTARKLVGHSGAAATDHDDPETLSEILLRIYGTGVLELYPRGPDFVMQVSERPVASRLARFQVGRGSDVANLRHDQVEIEDEIGRELLKLLDGTRSRDALLEDLAAAVRSGKVLLNEEGQPLRDQDEVRHVLSRDLETNLQKLAKLALLVS